MKYHSHYSQGRRKSGRQRWIWLYVFIVVALASGVYVGIKQLQRYPDLVRPVAEYYGRAASWIAERKSKLSQTASAVRKNVQVSDDPERVVDFEFYNTLQDMQSMQSQVEAEAISESSKVNAVKAPVKTAAVNPPEKKQVKAVAAVNAPKSKTNKTVKISQAADLERDLLAAMKQQAEGK